MPPEIVPNRGFGYVPFGYGLFGLAMTIEGDNEAEVTPLDLDLEAQQLGGTSGVSAEIVVAELAVDGQTAKAGVIRQLPDRVEWSKP